MRSSVFNGCRGKQIVEDLRGCRVCGLDRVREEDLDVLAADAYADACRPGNPRDTNVDELKALYRKIMA